MAAGAPLSLRYHSDQLNNKVLGLLREFYLTGEFCDVVLHVGSLKISAHRIVLAAFSPYFRSLFHQPSNKNSSDITLQGPLKEDAVQQLVDFCYSSDITVDSQSADKILTAANFLQIKEVEKLCITFLAAQQALKSEHANQPQASPAHVPTSLPLRSPTETAQKGDNSRELACADTSGIGSNHTSPRHSSRPSSVPSGNGSVQPLEDTDLEMVEVKKEHDELSMSDPPYFAPSSSGSWVKPDYESLRTSMASFPRFFFPPVTGALSLPTTPSHHQLLMKALTQSSTSPTDLRDFGEFYMGKLPVSSHLKDESPSLTSEEGGYSESSQTHQCHICLKLFQGLASLKAHMSEHQDTLTVPSASTYKMMSPVRKLSTSSLSQATSPVKADGEDFGGSNMCGTCGKTFRDPQSLKFHRYNHVLRYQCNYCGKRFSRSWNLHRHRKTHYRQLQDTGLGSDDVTVIDVENVKSDGASPSPYLDKDKILTSPYADYRNHRHDMMPFAFNMRRVSGTSSYNGDDDRDDKSNDMTEKENDMMSFAFDMRRIAGNGGYRNCDEQKDKQEDLQERDKDSEAEDSYPGVKSKMEDNEQGNDEPLPLNKVSDVHNK